MCPLLLCQSAQGCIQFRLTIRWLMVLVCLSWLPAFADDSAWSQRRVAGLQVDVPGATATGFEVAGVSDLISDSESRSGIDTEIDINTESVSDAAEPVLEVVPEVPPEPMAIDSGYWIVSTENSPQSFDDSLPKFCAVVRRYEHCRGVRAASLGELLASLTPGIPVCIMVHGSFMDSPSVVPESAKTWQWLRHGAGGRPFQMIYFRWPSWKLPTALINIDIAVLGRRASRNGFYLASLLQQLPPESPVSLLGHSHGTRVISAAAHLLAGGSVEGFCLANRATEPTGQRIRAVFAASAIDHDWLNPGERFDRALSSLQCVLNLRNRLDPALLLYPMRHPGSRRALGLTGLTQADRRALGDRSSRVRDLDVSESIGCRHIWPSWTAETSIAHRASSYLFWPE